MKILAISDTHGNVADIAGLAKVMDGCDYIFHTGDHDYDMQEFIPKYGKKLYTVKGNCDGGGEELVLSVGGVKIMLVHGDRYHVKLSLLRLRLRAEELGVRLVFYGHTHLADITEENGITYINPGALAKGYNKTYCIAEINNGIINASIKSI